MKGSRRTRGRQTRKTQLQGNNMQISHPPQIANLNIVHSTRMRFVLSSAMTDQNVTFQNLLDIFLIGSGAAALTDLFNAVKIRKIEIWAVPVIGGSTTVSVTFVGTVAGLFSQSKTVTDTSMGVQPAHISAVPSRLAPTAQWQQSEAADAFQLTAPTGAVVDLELSFSSRYNNGIAAQNAGVAVTAGNLYVRGFDGLAAAASKAVPQVDPTTAVI